MSYDLVSFGEAMVRLSPPDFKRLEQTTSLDLNIGGSEFNIAVGASRLGLRAAWVSRLADNPLGHIVRNKAREQGVDTSHVVWSKKDRCGLYFVEYGASPRASRVVYDRAHSAIANIQPGEVNWKTILAGTRVFMVSGITPALSRSAREATVEAVKAAKASGCKVLIDLNYRKNLWSAEEANRCLEPLMHDTDILSTTEEDTKVVLGIEAAKPKAGKSSDEFQEVAAESYREVAEKLDRKFGFEAIVITLRENPLVWRNTWTAIAYAKGKLYRTRKYELEIVDRVGGGDSFTAGFLYGYLTGDAQKGVDYGVAFSALKHTFPGDINWSTLAEVEAQVQGAGLRIAR
jgi:2-dehydro-3-deoxygluconokinase